MNMKSGSALIFRRMFVVIMILTLTVAFMPFSAFATAQGTGGQDGKKAVQQYDAGSKSIQLQSTASSAVDTVQKICSALEKMGMATGPFANMGKAREVFLRISGVGVSVVGFAGAGVAILQMSGIIEDPTSNALSQIMTEIGNVQDQLAIINGKLNEISEDLSEISADQKEINRQNNARALLKNWSDFNTAYVEKMADFMEKYQGFINEGVASWWGKDHTQEGNKYILYTHLQTDDSVALTYSRTGNALPETADNGEVVDKALSIGIPAECMPATSNFNANTYKADFVALYTSVIKNAADQHKLIVDASSSFYEDWAGLDEDKKNEKATAYAEDLFSSIMYQIACTKMTEQNQFVIDVRNAYTNYCNNITKKDTGIDALINVLYVTHAFEGEVKEDIVNYCNGMVLQAGIYGEFALSCARQSSLQTDSNLEALAGKWSDTVTKLYDMQNTSLTGFDNYCYITNQVLDYSVARVESTASVKWHYTGTGGLCYDSFSATDWKITDKAGEAFNPSVLRDDYAKVLYRYYLSQKTGDETFEAFLKKNNVGTSSTYYGKIVTRFKGTEVFNLDEGIQMTCHAIDTNCENFGNYFSKGKMYRINKDNPSKVKGNCFVLHDRALCNYMNYNDGSFETNYSLATRALYAEHRSIWMTDEAHAFYRNTNVTSTPDRDGKYYIEKLTFTSLMPILTLSPVATAVLPGGSEPTALNRFIENFSLEYPDPKVVAMPSGKKLTYNGKAQKGVEAGSLYNVTGNVAKDAGSYSATVSLKDNDNYVWPDGSATSKIVTWEITKAANPLKVKPKKATVKYKKLKKNDQTLAVTKFIKFKKKVNDKKSYTLSTAKKGKKKYTKYFAIDATTGKVTIRQGLKKGTYKVKVKVRATGNANYKASGWKTVTFRVRVK